VTGDVKSTLFSTPLFDLHVMTVGAIFHKLPCDAGCHLLTPAQKTVTDVHNFTVVLLCVLLRDTSCTNFMEVEFIVDNFIDGTTTNPQIMSLIDSPPPPLCCRETASGFLQCSFLRLIGKP
jgi:hypothetical protein